MARHSREEVAEAVQACGIRARTDKTATHTHGPPDVIHPPADAQAQRTPCADLTYGSRPEPFYAQSIFYANHVQPQ
jgi:hypothetical protein